jgi:hypothetical protein
MKAPKKALLLVGSPKLEASTSESLGCYLLEELEKRGVATQTIHVTKAVRNDETKDELCAVASSADLIVLSFPLYVDSLPAPTVRALEVLAGRPAGSAAFLAICQSGFPEVEHSEVAIEICRNFADDAGLEWAGSLVLAAGGMISGQPLRKLQGMMRSAIKALDLTAEALAAGHPVPDEAVQLMAKPPIPKIGYRFAANWGWRAQARKAAAGTPLDAQPYG